MTPAVTVLSAYYKHKPGGFTKRLYRAYRGLDAAGCRVIYVAAEKLPVEGSNIHPVLLPMRSKPGSPFFWLEFYVRAVCEMRRLTRMESASVHLMFSFSYASISILAGWGLGAKTLTFVRADDVFDSRQKRNAWLRMSAHKVLEKLGMRYSTKVMTTSESMKTIITRRSGGGDKTISLPNDISTHPLAVSLPDIHREVVRIVTVSVLNQRKNLRFMLEALSRLQHDNWEYFLVGGDTSNAGYLQELQTLAEQRGIADRVKFLGWRDDIATVLQDCHLFVLPTLHEGSPNALLEAIGYGIPCMASDIPEIREILLDSELLFSPDQPEELVNRLDSFLSLSGYARSIREKTARCKARYTFDWDGRVVKLVSLGRAEG